MEHNLIIPYSDLRGVIFDVNGVLVNGAYAVVLRRFFTALGEAVPIKRLEELIFRNASAIMLRRGLIQLRHFWQEINDTFQREGYNVTIAEDTFLDILFRDYQLLEGNSKLLLALKEKGYKLAILSNHFNGGREVLARQVPLNLFDAVVLSNEIGMNKPLVPVFWLTARGRLKLEPWETIFLTIRREM